MGVPDFAILALYGLGLIAIAVFVSRKRVSAEEYYLGSKNLGAAHIGLSVAATDVGGGFSIGLGAFGFSMGLAGSWLLFTGLVGAFLSAVFLIPRLKQLELTQPYFSYPQVIAHYYGDTSGRIAALLSFVGYLAFTAAQLMAGTKLACTLMPSVPFSWMMFMLAGVAVGYTTIGGLRAVVYTDTIQWIIVIIGLSCFAIPFAVIELDGLSQVIKALPRQHMSLTNIPRQQFLNWMISIVPIWFVGMSLYQRIFACRDKQEAQRAWLIAGLFEWPIMAFVGVSMGMLARAAIEQGLIVPSAPAGEFDQELAIPLLLRSVLPTGLLGLVFAAYLSAVLSTADSCLMAASGNLYSDFLQGRTGDSKPQGYLHVLSQRLGPKSVTLLLGFAAFIIANQFEKVLNLMLYAYGFMISGLFVPTMAAMFLKNPVAPASAVGSMLIGVMTYLVCKNVDTGGWDANWFGILASLMSLLLIELIVRRRPVAR